MDVTIRTLDNIPAASIRHQGPYNQVGPCFERLVGWALSTGAPIGRAFMMSWDNPEFVAPENLRSDACIEFETDATPPDGISLETIDAAGSYAVYVHSGPYAGLPAAYQKLFAEWLPASGEHLAERACIEFYLNSPMDTPPEDLVTEIWLPLAEPEID
ncbi:MAG: GyrI-like domain-containing protein [Paracoccaceae bacterium]|nr:GyrI-like domain-containing protein [Paracoccaceae bacterium]